MTTLNNTTETNNLKFTTSKIRGGKNIIVSIILNDECKNGHQDFAITGDIYKANAPKTNRNWLSGGCVHDEILKAFPEFKIFIDLHLCDFDGVPMGAVENGFYFLSEGFNDIKPEDKTFGDEFCKYYRISEDQFKALSQSKNKLQYALNLQNLGILAQWKEQAQTAIKLLEDMTGAKFLNDSKRSQYNAPTEAEMLEEEEKVKSGYYTKEAEQKREEARQQKEIKFLEEDAENKISKIREELQVKKEVLRVGGTKALKNCIFYNHTRTLKFNWRGYESISDELINKVIAGVNLPEGVKIER